MASKKIPLFSARVNLGGDRNHELHKRNLTAAEIVVLQHIHGDASVHDIAPESGSFDGDRVALLDSKYGRVRVGDGGDKKPVLVRVFPSWPKADLPDTLKDARVNEALIAEVSAPVSNRGKQTAAEKKAAEQKTAETSKKIEDAGETAAESGKKGDDDFTK